jgi:hypothetical protein
MAHAMGRAIATLDAARYRRLSPGQLAMGRRVEVTRPRRMEAPGSLAPESASRRAAGRRPGEKRLADGRSNTSKRACRLDVYAPDEGLGARRPLRGVARGTRTALIVSTEQVALLRHRGPCPLTRAPRPVGTNRAAKRRLVSWS